MSDEKVNTQRIRISLDGLDCRNRDDGLNDFLKLRHAKILSYKLHDNELEFVICPSDRYSHYFLLCKCKNSDNQVLQDSCEKVEVNKQYYVTITDPDPKLSPTYNMVILKVIENVASTWYIVE